MQVDHIALGGAGSHATRTGVASLVVDDEEGALDALAAMLSYLPDNNMARTAAYIGTAAIGRTQPASCPRWPARRMTSGG